VSDKSACATYDVEAKGVPRFVAVNYIDLDHVARISRFRSAVGHDYSDDFESCRSMKHYVDTPPGTRVWAPVDGDVIYFDPGLAMGSHIEIQSTVQPAFFFDIFHAVPTNPIKVGDHFRAGQLIGTHTNGTFSDVAVAVLTPQVGPRGAISQPGDPGHGWKLISYFQVITDSIFALYTHRGVTSRDTMIIAQAVRDAHPIDCATGFSVAGRTGDWYNLSP
jgi:hypothetical protein